ncbi:hypothetical protein [Reichenbachiella sp. MSK19-1]|uniref:hypothetical protein n=1 Tax=Reichenbachiella sp. MSK19-1 TaxID=1897631 RepID=UPI000E6BD1C1|nr:hypothetical protein [Reichenbachiella sp. MSK19-1]RJE74384.1 hypothetical protein BGP76_14575 [Reichenbachiella sp. MSK19-1]
MVNLPIEYSSKPVTPFIDMSLMKRFIDPTGIREKLDELDVPALGSSYDPKHIIERFWLSIWGGASLYVYCDWLRSDEVLQSNKRGRNSHHPLMAFVSQTRRMANI